MKNLANCTPVEFLRQTNKIRHFAADWLELTKIFELKKKAVEITDDMTDDELESAKNENRKRMKEAISDMLDVALDTHAEETAKLLGLLCFVDPDHINDHKITVYLKEIGEIISDKDVIDFFISLMRLDQIGILNVPKR